MDTTASDEERRDPRSPPRRGVASCCSSTCRSPILPGLDRAQRAAADFVRRRLALSDLAAVATFDINNGIRLMANFTEDRGLLAHAIGTLGVPSLTRISDPLGLAADLNVTDLRPAPSGGEEATPQQLLDDVMKVMVSADAGGGGAGLSQHVDTLLAGLDTLAQALRGVEGASRSSISRRASTRGC